MQYTVDGVEKISVFPSHFLRLTLFRTMKFWYEFILDYYSFLSMFHTEQHFLNLSVVSLEKGEVFNATYNFVFTYIWLY